MPLNCVEEIVAGARRDRSSTDATDHPGPRREPDADRCRAAGACQYRNACWLGCPFGAYFSTQSSTLPAAMATGN